MVNRDDLRVLGDRGLHGRLAQVLDRLELGAIDRAAPLTVEHEQPAGRAAPQASNRGSSSNVPTRRSLSASIVSGGPPAAPCRCRSPPPGGPARRARSVLVVSGEPGDARTDLGPVVVDAAQVAADRDPLGVIQAIGGLDGAGRLVDQRADLRRARRRSREPLGIEIEVQTHDAVSRPTLDQPFGRLAKAVHVPCNTRRGNDETRPRLSRRRRAQR
jgi:hypothetical protein